MTSNGEKQLRYVEYFSLVVSGLLAFLFAPAMYFVVEEPAVAVIIALIGLIDYPVTRYLILPTIRQQRSSSDN